MTAPSILLLGGNGRLGWELQRSLAPLGVVHAPARAVLDVRDGAALSDATRALAPRWIVNAVAYNDVDRAEHEAEAARALNVELPARLADLALAHGAALLHVSTDQVFDGAGTEPHDEDHPMAPLNAYGRSKRDGERAVRGSGCRHLIVRTAWLHTARGAHFLRTVLARASEQHVVDVVADQWGAPTGVDLVADVIAHLMRDEAEGTLHVTAAGETSRHAYAEWGLERARALGWPVRARHVRAIRSDHGPDVAARPSNARLSLARLQQRHGLVMPPWQHGAERTLLQMTATRRCEAGRG